MRDRSTFLAVRARSTPWPRSIPPPPPPCAPETGFSPTVAAFPVTSRRPCRPAPSFEPFPDATGVHRRTPRKAPLNGAIDRDILRRLPKAGLHCHLDGSVRPQTLIDLGREYGVAMPRDNARALAEYMHVNDARHLEDY